LGEIICHGNSRLTAECIAIVTGLNFTGASMTEVARKHGVSRAAVSKRCVELTELLGLRPSRAMRPLASRTASRAARIQITQSYETTHPTA
jgi:transposase-like protein